MAFDDRLIEDQADVEHVVFPDTVSLAEPLEQGEHAGNFAPVVAKRERQIGLAHARGTWHVPPCAEAKPQKSSAELWGGVNTAVLSRQPPTANRQGVHE